MWYIVGWRKKIAFLCFSYHHPTEKIYKQKQIPKCFSKLKVQNLCKESYKCLFKNKKFKHLQRSFMYVFTIGRHIFKKSNSKIINKLNIIQMAILVVFFQYFKGVRGKSQGLLDETIFEVYKENKDDIR